MRLFAGLYASLLLSTIFFSCNNNAPGTTNQAADTVATTQPNWALLPFTKVDSANPILTPGQGSFMCPVRKQNVLWENKDVFNPALVVRNDTVFLLYRAQDSIGKPGGTSRIGLAFSTDGVHFKREKAPVFYPENDAYKKYEWEGGCEDPRIVEDSSGTYYMTYTAYDGKTARLLVATSTNLHNWVKHGPAFMQAYNGKYKDVWSKSGSIVSTYNTDGKIVATKINGKYWMYWGDKYLWAATSDDLINWQPVEKEAGDTSKTEIPVFEGVDVSKLVVALKYRPNKFDNDLVESGPPAMLTADGIVLLYNGRNVPATGDKSLAEGTYTSCQALFDKTNPAKVIDRMNDYFMKPDKPYEITGQVNQVCFIEGLARFKSHWWLYYGTADSKIAVAVK